jgi:cell division protein FtsX
MNLRLLRLVLKYIFRNPARTVITVCGVMVAILVFSFFYAVNTSLTAMITKSSGSQNLIVQQEGHW